MKITVTEHIGKPPGEVFRMVSDLNYLLENVDPDVISTRKTSEGQIGVGTTFLEVLKIPMSTSETVLEITAFDQGKSFEVNFDNNVMKGVGSFNFAQSGDGTDVTLRIDTSAKPGLGWLVYPMVRMDLPKREKNRFATLKRLVESGDMDASKAEGLADSSVE